MVQGYEKDCARAEMKQGSRGTGRPGGYLHAKRIAREPKWSKSSPSVIT